MILCRSQPCLLPGWFGRWMGQNPKWDRDGTADVHTAFSVVRFLCAGTFLPSFPPATHGITTRAGLSNNSTGSMALWFRFGMAFLYLCVVPLPSDLLVPSTWMHGGTDAPSILGVWAFTNFAHTPSLSCPTAPPPSAPFPTAAYWFFNSTDSGWAG